MGKITKYEFISVEELASELGISKGSAYKLVKSGDIKVLKIGSHFKVPTTAVDEYISRMTGLPIPQTRGVTYDS